MDFISPYSQVQRGRLASSMRYWHKEHEQYRRVRRDLIKHHVGSPQWLGSLGVEDTTSSGDRSRMLANLIQMAAKAHMLTVAYGTPRFNLTAMVPEADHHVDNLQESLNRYVEWLGLKSIGRQLALDSYFGYAIAQVDVGMLPPQAKSLLNREIGAMCRRVSQDDYMFDGDATSWEYVSWQAHLETVPLVQARNFQPFLEFNPDRAMELEEFTFPSIGSESRAHDTSSGHQTAMAMTRLVHVYLPFDNLVASWPANNIRFDGIEGDPLLVREWRGHHTGPYDVQSQLDIPDNLLPVTEAESTKRLADLFNELGDITSEQARKAKINPVYKTGNHRDQRKIENAKDRESVGVSNVDQQALWERPGPTQSQTAYMMSTLQMFKEFSGNLDDVLGLAPAADTATGAELIRQKTSARSADKKNRMNTQMEMIARKLIHLILNDETLIIPARRPIDNEGQIFEDLSWLDSQRMPRVRNADAYDLHIEPYTLEYRDPAIKVAQINEATAQIFDAVKMASQGAPIDLEEFIKLQADYRRVPELKKIFNGLLPEFRMKLQQGQQGASKQNKGVYTRRNVSSQNTDGGLEQNLVQAMGNDNPDNVRTG